MTEFLSLEALAARIPDGSLLAIPPDHVGVAMAATRALLRRGARGLRLLTVPTSGLQADLLIGAGAVAEIETAGVMLGEAGSAGRFTAAIKAGSIAIRDATCPAIHAGLQAAEKGIPFMPLRGILGSDLIGRRPDWRTMDNPYGNADPLLLLPALKPDIALFHAPLADRAGNVWIGRRRELATMAHAARVTLVTVERDSGRGSLRDRDERGGEPLLPLCQRHRRGAEGRLAVGPRRALRAGRCSSRGLCGSGTRESGFRDYLAQHVL